MPILRDLSLFWSMLHVTILFLMLFRSKYNKRTTTIVAAVGIGLLMVGNCLGLVFFGVEIMGRMLLFTCTIPSIILFYTISEDKSFRFLFTFCLADTACLWILGATNIIDQIFGGGQFILMFILRLVAFPLMEYWAYKYLRDVYIKLQDVVQEGWAIFSLTTAIYYLLLVMVLNFPTNLSNRPEDIPLATLILVLMFCNYGSILVSLYRQMKIYTQEQSERLLQEQKNYLEAQLDNQQHIRKMKHDMRGHVVAMSGLLKSGKTTEAMEYLKTIESDIDSVGGIICENPYINAVLSHYYNKFQQIGVKLSTQVHVGNDTKNNTELCSILSNGLENAFEAVNGLPSDRRLVSVQIKRKKAYILIRIRNSCDSRLVVVKGDIPHTDKKEEDHGFGLNSIKETAEKLGGDMLCYTDDGNFVLDVSLKT